MNNIKKKASSKQDGAALALLKTSHWLCKENIPISKFGSLQQLFHDLGLEDISLLKDKPISYQSYFSGLEFVESLNGVVDEELCEKLAKSPVVTVLADESTDICNHNSTYSVSSRLHDQVDFHDYQNNTVRNETFSINCIKIETIINSQSSQT